MLYLIFLWMDLFFVCISTEVNQLTCNDTELCYGVRPKLENGCCPARVGTKCDLKLNCDKELGFNCLNGYCTGKNNLTVTWTGKTRLNLTWTPFLPAGSNDTYTLLYATEFPTDVDEMNSHHVGNVSMFSLEDLVPGTWYYIQVAVWSDDGYQNLSETALAQTEALDHCVYNGRRISVGDDFIIDCEESCYCSPSGRFQCVPICQKQSEISVCADRDSRDQCCIPVNHCYNDSCTYLGEAFEHRYSWIIDCAENCTCFDGFVTCVPLCDDVIDDMNCTNAVITETHDGCCQSRQCYEEDTCVYKNTSYKTDTWFRTDCEICTCSSETREVSCVDLKRCGTQVLPDLSPVCPHPTLQDGHCCSMLNCENRAGPNDILGSFAISVFSETSIIVQFHFISSKDVLEAIQMTLYYTTDTSGAKYTSWVSNVTYSFNNAIDSINETFQYRDFGKPLVLYKISKDFLFVLPNLVINKYYFVKLKIDFDKSKRVVQEYVTTTKAIKIPGAPTHLMSTLNTVNIQVVNISSNSAFLSWFIPEKYQYNITSFVIKYKSLADRNWQYTKRLIFSDRHIQILCLFSQLWYEVLLEAYPGARRLATTFFNTTAVKELSDKNFSIKFTNVSIRTNSIFVAWKLKFVSVGEDKCIIEILWSSVNSEEVVYKDCIPGDLESYTIENLHSGSMYTVWLGINLPSRETVYSSRLHVVTKHAAHAEHSSTNHSIVVAITVACVSLFAMIAAIATVIYLLKCKRRATYQNHTSFENRIFQIYSSKDDREV
ncbi:hypothetical protein ACF0H5_003687 [Mactra antiquata]